MKRFSFLLFVILVVLPVVHADDWPQWLGPHRNGVSAEKGLLSVFSKGGPKKLWHRDIGEGFAGVVVAGERLIVFHRVGNEEIVDCLNASTGKDVWRFAYPCTYSDPYSKGNGPRSTPLITGDKVVTLGADGMLHCVSLDAGKKIWSRSLTADYKASLSYFGMATSPIVEEGLVLVNVGGKQAGIVAFDLNSGKEAWTATTDPMSYSSPIVTTIDGQRQAIFFTRTGPVVLEPKTGKVLYQQRFRSRNDLSVNAATPLMIGDQAFFTASYETGALLLKLKKDGASELWHEEELMASQYNTSVVHDCHIYGFDGRVDSRTPPSFRCIDVKSKKIKWDQPDFGNGSLILADGKLIALTEKGDLCLVEATPTKFHELARVTLFRGGQCRAQIALANGRLYARDQKQLVCIEMKR